MHSYKGDFLSDDFAYHGTETDCNVGTIMTLASQGPGP